MTTTATVSEKLRTIADLIDAHPDLPLPYVTAFSTGTTAAAWYLHIGDFNADLPGQKAAAALIVSTLGGKWAKSEGGEDFRLTQKRDTGLSLEVVVHRAAVCERVVTGSHEVTVPAMPARDAAPERVETVEDVTWRCSSLLAEPAKPDLIGQTSVALDAETIARVNGGRRQF